MNAQQPEYIITNEDLDCLLAVRCKPNSHLDVWDWVKTVKKTRTRPRTQAPVAIPLKSCFGEYDDRPLRCRDHSDRRRRRRL